MPCLSTSFRNSLRLKVIMATTTIDVASFQLALAECADAVNATDWSTARSKHLLASVIHAGLLKRSESGSKEIERHEINQLNSLGELIDAVEAKVKQGTDNNRVIRFNPQRRC